jgi:hypothetical protein
MIVSAAVAEADTGTEEAATDVDMVRRFDFETNCWDLRKKKTRAERE